MQDQNEKIEQYNQQLQQQTQSLENQLQDKLAIFAQNITSQVDRKLERKTQQLKDTLVLQDCLHSGNLPINDLGMSFSPQLALYLVEKLATNEYDLIIEFGGGSTTNFLARTVLNRGVNCLKKQEPVSQDRDKQNSNEFASITPKFYDLQNYIVSFEHREELHANLEHVLAVNGMQDVVRLIYAPLVNYVYNEQNYLFYNCDSTLKNLSRLYAKSTANFLILVNGPPTKTGRKACFPALPKLLNTLQSHKMDIILNDTLRAEGQAITEDWCKILEQNRILFRKEIIDLGQGNTLLTINSI